MFNKKLVFALLLLILALAVFLRFWRLDQIPPGLYPDVAVNGTNALDALKTGNFKIFYPDNNGREGLFINIIALSLWLFGPSIWAIKFVAAIIGSLTILGLYLLARNMFGHLPQAKRELIALLSAFLLTFSFWHLDFSRLGFRAIMVPFILAWSFYFLFKGLKATQIFGLHTDGSDDKGWAGFYLVIAGLFFGLGFHTYISYRVAPLILLPLLFFSFLAIKKHSKKLVKKTLIYWVIFFVSVFIIAAPIGYYFLTHSQDFMGRTGQVSVLSSANPLKELAISVAKTLGMFNIQGDCNWRHNYACQPELLWPVGLFFLIGIGLSFFEAFRPKNWRQKDWWTLSVYWTLIFIFFGMLLPAIMSREGLPHALRSIGAIPPTFIFAGLGLAFIFWLFQDLYFKKGWRLFLLYALLFLALAGIGFTEFYRYFFDWGTRQETKSEFTQQLVNEGNYINFLPDNVIKYVLANEGGVPVPYPDGIPMPTQTIMFITYGKENIKYLLPSQNSQVLITDGPTVFVPLKYEGEIFKTLQEKFPNGKIEKIQNEFSVFRIGF